MYGLNNTNFRGLLMNITEAILPETRGPVANPQGGQLPQLLVRTAEFRIACW